MKARGEALLLRSLMLLVTETTEEGITKVAAMVAETVVETAAVIRSEAEVVASKTMKARQRRETILVVHHAEVNAEVGATEAETLLKVNQGRIEEAVEVATSHRVMADAEESVKEVAITPAVGAKAVEATVTITSAKL